MKKFLRFSLFILLVPALLFSSCKKDTETPERTTDPEFQALTAYMAANSMDLSDVLASPWYLTAASIKDNLNDYFIIDLRGTYDAGHIPGAVSATLTSLLDVADDANGKTIIVACFSGQSAGHAVTALRLSGYSNAASLLFGMSSWHSTLDSWTAACDTKTPHASWIDPAGSIVANKEFDDPDLPAYSSTDAEFLAQRVDAMLAAGFKGDLSADILAAPGSFFINNYWAATDVETYGNIIGAYRIQPLTIAGEEFKHIDPSKTVATYCWTGQTSSVITAYLNVIGYTATSLKNGANSMIYDNLTAHKWSAATGCPEDLPLEATTK